MNIDELQSRVDVPVISANHRGYVTGINERFSEAFGWEAAELVGKPLPTIIPAHFHAAHHLGFSRFLTTGKPTLLERPLNLGIVMADGREVEAEHYIVAEERVEGWVFAAMIRPLE